MQEVPLLLDGSVFLFEEIYYIYIYIYIVYIIYRTSRCVDDHRIAG